MPADWIAIQRNPTSGKGSGRRKLLELVRGLQRSGTRVRLFSRRERLNETLACTELRESLRCIVAAGGDGTVRDIVERFPDTPVAVFPLGTENLLAKYLRVTTDPHSAARMILHGRTESFNLGQVNSRRFLLMLSVGFDAEVVHQTDARRRGNISKWSYLQTFWSALRKYEYPEIRVVSGGESAPFRGSLAVISNFPTYAMQLPIAARANPSDGLLDLRLFQNGSSASMISYMLSVWRGRHESRTDVLSHQSATYRIESDRPVPVQVDGDPAGFTPIDVCVLPQPIRLIVPEHFPFSPNGTTT